MKKKFYGAVVLFIAAAMVFSSVAIANTEVKEEDIELSTIHQGTANGALGPVVWDNGMDYDGICSAQYDTGVPFESECADDFHFEEDTEVFDVHWIAAYWNGDNYNQVHWPWEIIFYLDDGSGTAPGNVYAGPFQYDSTQYTEVLLEDTGDPASGIYYEISVDLPENILFPACYKFWISIQGIGDFSPQSGWAFHFDPIKLHEAVFRSVYFGYPDWTPWSTVAPPDQRDLCFQLTEFQPCDPCIDVEKYVWDNRNQAWVDADTETEALDVPICDEVTFKIVVHNCGDTDITNIKITDKMHMSLKYISADPEPDKVVQEDPDWIITWIFPGPLKPCETIEVYITAHVEGPECSNDYNHVFVEGEACGNQVSDEDWCWVHAIKKSKSANHPLLAWLENHLNMFPLLQKLLKLIALF